jgi:hypothetical protein
LVLGVRNGVLVVIAPSGGDAIARANLPRCEERTE